MSEQFDMTIYNIALNNGSYTQKGKTLSQNISTQYVGENTSAPNVIYMAEGFNLNNIEQRNFSENEKK